MASSSRFFAFLLLLWLSFNQIQLFCFGYKSQNLFDIEPEVYLTVSSEPDCPLRRWWKPWTWFTQTQCDRRLELNWFNFDKHFVDSDSEYFVALYPSNPSLSSSSPEILDKCPVGSSLEAKSGYFKTAVRFDPGKSVEVKNFQENPCFPYWIAYQRKTRQQNGSDLESVKVLKTKCLRVHSTWMTKLGEEIGDLPVTSIFIPGTHNSGSWERYRGLLHSEINPLAAYEITQEESIYEQLVYGIRYLDVRVTHHPFLPNNKSSDGSDIFWISHDSFLPQISLRTLLMDVARFQEETNRKEILFVDFHRVTIVLKEVNQSEHRRIHSQLIELIDQYLGAYLVSYESNDRMTITPNLLWKLGKSVFVTYPDTEIRKSYSFLWPPFHHSWADTNHPDILENYLSEDLHLFGCQGRFWTLMAELTPTTRDILTRPHLGLRGMAQLINGNVSSWFRRESWYSRTFVVASDYFLGNNLIEMAIKVNQNGAVCTN